MTMRVKIQKHSKAQLATHYYYNQTLWWKICKAYRFLFRGSE